MNFVLTFQNSAAFQALPQKELRSIRHLTTLWDTLQSVMLLPPSANPLHRALIMASIEANLETLTLDLRKENPFRGPIRCHIWIPLLKFLVSSAQGGFRNITVVCDANTSTEHEQIKLISDILLHVWNYRQAYRSHEGIRPASLGLGRQRSGDAGESEGVHFAYGSISVDFDAHA